MTRFLSDIKICKYQEDQLTISIIILLPFKKSPTVIIRLFKYESRHEKYFFFGNDAVICDPVHDAVICDPVHDAVICDPVHDVDTVHGIC